MPRYKQVDKVRAAELRNAGATYKEIAAIQGVSPQAIHKSIQDLLPTEDTAVYRKHRAEILSNLQSKILLEVDGADLKTLMAKQPSAMALWFNSLFNAERLERGQSTANVESVVTSIQGELTDLMAHRAQLAAKVTGDTSVIQGKDNPAPVAESKPDKQGKCSNIV